MDFEEEERRVIRKILDDFETEKFINTTDNFEEPDVEVISGIIEKLFKIIYPGFYKEKSYRVLNKKSYAAVLIEDVMNSLKRQVYIALRQLDENKEKSVEEVKQLSSGIVIKFFDSFPKIRDYLNSDIDAAYDGDPAAFDKAEIVLSYPGLYAITVNRFAHELFLLGVPLIPRIMTELAHSHTGIDIHPGATLGKRFFIDHGTGIVIGETTVIGNDVKVYQGVTLGALSTNGGQTLKGVKRHPTIEDNVTIYSGASILGGETVIGKGCVIGGNTFITHSVAPETVVSIKNQELKFKQRNKTSSSFEDVFVYMI